MYRLYYSHPITAKRLQVKGSRRQTAIIVKLLRDKCVLIWAAAANACLHIILPWAVPANLNPANHAPPATHPDGGQYGDAVESLPIPSPMMPVSPEWLPSSPSSLVSSSSIDEPPSPLDMLPVPSPLPSLPSLPSLSVTSATSLSTSTGGLRKRHRVDNDDVKNGNEAQMKRPHLLPEVDPTSSSSFDQKQEATEKRDEQSSSILEEVKESQVATVVTPLQSLPQQQVPTSSLLTPIYALPSLPSLPSKECPHQRVVTFIGAFESATSSENPVVENFLSIDQEEPNVVLLPLYQCVHNNDGDIDVRLI
jgi:hypothetical protein